MPVIAVCLFICLLGLFVFEGRIDSPEPFITCDSGGRAVLAGVRKRYLKFAVRARGFVRAACVRVRCAAESAAGSEELVCYFVMRTIKDGNCERTVAPHPLLPTKRAADSARQRDGAGCERALWLK